MSSILIFQPIVPSYRVPIFREMHKRFDAILCHSQKNQHSKIRCAAEKINFPNEVLRNLDHFGTNQKVLKVLKKHKPRIVLVGISVTNLTFYKLLFFRMFFRYKIIGWGHILKNSEQQSPAFTGFRGKLIKFALGKSNAVVFYSGERQNKTIKLMPGLTNKCFVAWNTLDLSENLSLFQKYKLLGKTKIKEQLGKKFNSRYNLLFVGRLLPDKGLDLILNVVELLSDKIDVSAHIIGEGPELKNISRHKLFNDRIFQHGAIYEEERLSKYFCASDLFIMPGYLGLSVVHAFSYGLPVISCKTNKNGPFHSPEVEYLNHGENGMLLENNPDLFANSVSELLSDSNKLKSMSDSAQNTAYTMCTLERMMHGFSNAINYVSEKPERYKQIKNSPQNVQR